MALLSSQQAVQMMANASQKAILDADAQINDPAINNSLANVEKATETANASLADLLAITQDGHKVADAATAAYMRPVKWWTLLIEKVLQVGPPIVTAGAAVH